MVQTFDLSKFSKKSETTGERFPWTNEEKSFFLTLFSNEKLTSVRLKASMDMRFSGFSFSEKQIRDFLITNKKEIFDTFRLEYFPGRKSKKLE